MAFYDQPENFRLPAELGLTPDQEELLRDVLWRDIISGETDPDAWFDSAECDDLAHLGPELVERAGAAVLQARREQQANFDEPNLIAAFNELASIDVIARGHFTCCGTCGSAEIWDEVDDTRPWRGYVFFHQQDTDELLENRNTYLSYGIFLPAWFTEEQWTGLASDEERDELYLSRLVPFLRDEVLPVFERHGIEVSWDGTHEQRIFLDNADYYVAV